MLDELETMLGGVVAHLAGHGRRLSRAKIDALDALVADLERLGVALARVLEHHPRRLVAIERDRFYAFQARQQASTP